MKNITLTFALTALAFSAALNFSLLTFRLGVAMPLHTQEQEAASYERRDVDYVNEMAAAAGK